MKRLARTTIYSAIAAAALVVGGTAAFAADLPTKAPPPSAPPAPPPSNWIGFIEVGYNFGQVNPQGQAVYKSGDYNIVGGAALNLYKSKDGFINSWSVGGLGIVDFTAGSPGPSDAIWASLNPSQGGDGLYYILSVNTAVGFAEYWTLSEAFFHLSGINANGGYTGPLPNGGMSANGVAANCVKTTGLATGAPLGCLDLPAWYWNELKLSLNDGAITKWPLSFNPYVTWWYEFFPSGNTGVLTTTTSAICFSCNNEPSDFIIGMTPKLNMAPYWNIPLTLTAPTWVTVGSKSVWAGNNGGGPGSGCVGPLAPNCSNGNVGVFSSGLTATLALTSIPAQWGHWSAKAGFQWFDIVNTALQWDNEITWGTSIGLKQDIVVGFVGLGVGF